jgi:hypothetical protein
MATAAQSRACRPGHGGHFFGSEPLPPGVAPTDIICASLAVDLIPKL